MVHALTRQPYFYLAAVVQKDAPSPEEIDAVHQRFCEAITELFDMHKHLMPGWETKQLTIV